MQNLYDTLGISRDADESAVKAAYRKKAQQLHPDRIHGDAEQFRAVQDAYDVLGNPERRERYDNTGEYEIPNYVQGVVNCLVALFNAVISQNDEYCNFIVEAKRLLNSEIVSTASSIHKMKLDLARTQKLSGRVKAKGDNLFQMIIDKKIEAISDSIKGAEYRKTILPMALKMIDDYTDNVPEYPNAGINTLFNPQFFSGTLWEIKP